MWLYKLYIFTTAIILSKQTFYCKRNNRSKNLFLKNFVEDKDIKFFEVSVTSASELEAIRNIKDHVGILEGYSRESNYILKNATSSKNYTSSYIEDEILFMESFISSFSSQSNITTPFSTNGVSINAIPIQVSRCKSTPLFETSNDDIGLSTKNHLISKLIPEFDQINRTLAVIPWKMINDTISNKIPEIQRISFKFSLIFTAISNNVELLKYYSENTNLKHIQWDALQMASFARGYSRYILETTFLALALILIAPNSESDSSFLREIDINSSLKYPQRILDILKEKNIENKNDYECMKFFEDSEIRNSCSFCSTMYLTLFSRLQCQFIEVGISRESILGVKWIEEIHSHFNQLYKLVFSIWNGYTKELYPNNSQYIPPKPFISWRAFRLKLYDEFRIGLNFQYKIEQTSVLSPTHNFLLSKLNKKDTDINSYVELKIMDSISNLDTLKKNEIEIIEKITGIYNEIVNTSNFSFSEVLMGSNTKLSNSLTSISLIIGTYGNKEFINSSIEKIQRDEYQLSNRDCRKLHRELNFDNDFSPSLFHKVFNKYLHCKYNFDIQLARLVSLQHRYEISKQILRKIIISIRNQLFEKIRERYSSLIQDNNSGFMNIFVKILSQFQIILGIIKIIKSNSQLNSTNIKELIPEIDYCTLSLEKFKIKLINYFFNFKTFSFKKENIGELNSKSNPLSPLSISIGPSIFDTIGNNLKKTTSKLRSKISLLNKLITFTRNILVERRNIMHGGIGKQEKNLMLYSKALRIYNNKDELFIADEFAKIVYKTLKNVAKSALKPILEDELNENEYFDFGEDNSCNLKHDILSLKNSPFLGCRLYSKAMEMIQIDELYTLLQRQFISIDNSERKIYFEISVLFDEVWPEFESNGRKQSFRKLSSKLYLLKTLLENMLIFNGIAKNSLLTYTKRSNSHACLFDFLIDTIERVENIAKEIPIYLNKKNSKIFFKNIGSAIKGLFVKKERVKRREKKNLEKEMMKFSRILSNLEPYIINIDISFKVNLDKLLFVKIETANRIKKLFYLYTHCIYSTLKNTILKGTLGKRIPLEVKNEWNEFIEQLNIVQISLFDQLNVILVSFDSSDF